MYTLAMNIANQIGKKNKHYIFILVLLTIVSEYDQEIPQSQFVDKPLAL